MPKGYIQISYKDTLTRGIQAFQRKQGVNTGKKRSVDFKAKAKVGLQLLNWIVNGSSKEPTIPPIKTGILRGSGSAFVGSELVGDSKGLIGRGDPNKSFSGNPNTVTVGFNTSYATRMHEEEWNPGPVSRQSGNVGNKFIKKHLAADGKNLTKLYAMFTKRING